MSVGPWIDRAYVGLLPDSSRFAAEASAQITAALKPVQAAADRVAEDIEDSFEDAAREADQALARIGGGGLVKVVVEAKVAAHEVEDAFEDAADDADRHLGRIGVGAGAFIGGAIKNAVTLGFTPDPDLVQKFVRPWESALATPLGLAVAAGVVGVAAPLVVAGVGAAATLGLGAAVVGLAAIGLRENEKIHKAFADAGKGIDEVLRRVAAPLQGPILAGLAAVGAAFDRLEAPLGRMVKALAPSIKPFVDGMIGFVNAALPGLEGAMPGVSAAFEAISRNLPGLGKSIGTFFKTIGDNKASLQLTVDLFFDIANILAVGLANGIKIAQDFLVGIWNFFQKDLRPELKRVSTAWEDNKNAILGLLGVGKDADEMFGDNKDAAKGLGDALVTLITTLGQIARALDTAGTALNTTEQTSNRWAKNIRGAIEGSIHAVEDTVQRWANNIRTWFQTTLTATENRVQGWADSIRNFFSTRIKAIEDTVQRWATNIRTWFQTTLTAVENRVQGWADSIRNFFSTRIKAIEDTVQRWATNIRTWFSTTLNAVETKVQGWADDVRAWFAGLPGRIFNALSNLGNLITTRIREAFDSFLAAAKEKWTTIRGWFEDRATSAKNAIGNLGSTLLQKGKDLLDGFLDGLKEKWKAITTWIKGIPQWIKDNKGPLSFDRGLLIPAGKAIMDGLGLGLLTGSSGPLSFLKNLTSTIGGMLKLNVGSLLGGVFKGSAGNFGSGSWQRAISELIKDHVGYQIISTFRPGARTHASGSVSFHALNRAVDLVGGNMMAIFNALIDTNPTELIYSRAPVYKSRSGWKSISQLDPVTLADHYSHVHAAYHGGGTLPEDIWGMGRSGRTYALQGGETVIARDKTPTQTVIVNVASQANPWEIGREVAWQLLVSGR